MPNNLNIPAPQWVWIDDPNFSPSPHIKNTITEELSSEPKTIGTLLKKARVFDSWSKVCDVLKKSFSFLPVKDSSHVGIEVEVENIDSVDFEWYFWNCIKDGSLRNNGKEFVSYPLKGEEISIALEWLNKQLYGINNPEFTSRTSVHIHVNVLDLTIEQLRSFLLLYLLFEKTLYSYVGGNRFNSIFCVPLSNAGYYKTLRTFFTYNMEKPRDFLHGTAETWHKYTGCNLKSLVDKGTVEFRHLPGTLDTTIIIPWINMLLSMKEYACQKSVDELFNEIKELNTNSEYDMMVNKVFGQEAHLLYPNLHKLMEKDVTHIKEIFTSFETAKFLQSKFKDSALGKWVLREENIFDVESFKVYVGKLTKDEAKKLLAVITDEYGEATDKNAKVLAERKHKIVYNYIINKDTISF